MSNYTTNFAWNPIDGALVYETQITDINGVWQNIIFNNSGYYNITNYLDVLHQFRAIGVFNDIPG
jgi:hypothetical protein